jgi:hypothetical protein
VSTWKKNKKKINYSFTTSKGRANMISNIDLYLSNQIKDGLQQGKV